MSTLDEFLDDLFASVAFAAFIDEAAIVGGAPCPTATKYRAYAYYEEALAEKNTRLQLAPRQHTILAAC